MHMTERKQAELGAELDAKLEEEARKNLMDEDEFASPNRPQDDRRQAVSIVRNALSAVKSARKSTGTPGTTTKEKIRSEMILGTERNPTSYDIRAFHVAELFADVVEANDLLAEAPAGSKDDVRRKIELSKERLSELLATTPGPRFKIPTQYRTDEEKLSYLDDKLTQVHEEMIANLDDYKDQLFNYGETENPVHQETMRLIEDRRMEIGKRFLRLIRARDEIAPPLQATPVTESLLSPVAKRTRAGRSQSVETASEPTKRGVSASADIRFTRDTIGMLSLWYPAKAMNWMDRDLVIRDQLLYTADGKYFITQTGERRAAGPTGKVLKEAKAWQLLNNHKTYPQPPRSDTILSPEPKTPAARLSEPDPVDERPVTERFYPVKDNLSNIHGSYDEKSRAMLLAMISDGKRPIIRVSNGTVYLDANRRMGSDGSIYQNGPPIALDIASYFEAIAPKPDRPSSIRRVPRTGPDPRLPTALTPSSPFGEVRPSSVSSSSAALPKATVVRDAPLIPQYDLLDDNLTDIDERYTPKTRQEIRDMLKKKDGTVFRETRFGTVYQMTKGGILSAVTPTGDLAPVFGPGTKEAINNFLGRVLPRQNGSGMSHQNGYDLVPTTRKRPLIDNYEYDDCSHHVSDGFSFGLHLTKYARHN